MTKVQARAMNAEVSASITDLAVSLVRTQYRPPSVPAGPSSTSEPRLGVAQLELASVTDISVPLPRFGMRRSPTLLHPVCRVPASGLAVTGAEIASKVRSSTDLPGSAGLT
jgi:hypothetical protein